MPSVLKRTPCVFFLIIFPFLLFPLFFPGICAIIIRTVTVQSRGVLKNGEKKKASHYRSICGPAWMEDGWKRPISSYHIKVFLLMPCIAANCPIVSSLFLSIYISPKYIGQKKFMQPSLRHGNSAYNRFVRNQYYRKGRTLSDYGWHRQRYLWAVCFYPFIYLQNILPILKIYYWLYCYCTVYDTLYGKHIRDQCINSGGKIMENQNWANPVYQASTTTPSVFPIPVFPYMEMSDPLSSTSINGLSRWAKPACHLVTFPFKYFRSL